MSMNSPLAILAQTLVVAVARQRYESTPGGQVVAETQRYILEAIADLGGGPVGVMQISRQAGINRATVGQHCKAMAAELAPRLIATRKTATCDEYSIAGAR
jgi:hypothetical protein